MKNTILIVDDAEINRSLLIDMLSGEYEILEASNGLEALALINRHASELSVVLLDIIMPEMDGFEVLAAMNSNGWVERIPVIIISAENSSSYIEHAYGLGAVEYINRPFDANTVQRRVKNIAMLYSKQRTLENMVTSQILEREKSTLTMVAILGHIVEFRNGESGLHVLHIRIITEHLLKTLARKSSQYTLTPSRITLITNASALHDIGKISIPDAILNKPGKLTPEEYEIIKTHSTIGAEMLENIPYFQSDEMVHIARDICRWHHERYDGGGYPDGLRGDNIPIAAQVVALADVYDALTSKRVYKPAYTHEKAMEMIANGECGSFNPVLLECLQASSSYLQKELQIRSAGGITRDELQDASRSLLRHDSASNRTLALLEQERTKYQFFASMSQEIQFEYVYRSDLLTLSEWSAKRLGVSEVIAQPWKNGELYTVLARKDYMDLKERLAAATPDDPIVSRVYCLHIHGEERWYKVVARPLWVGDEEYELTGIIGKFMDIHNEQLALDHFKQMAQKDALTGLYNGAYAKKKVEQALAKGNGNKKFALLLFDLDYFKSANDRYGHMFGDQLLQAVAQRVCKSVRNTDIVARIGGDEFLIFMEYKEDSTPLVERIFDSISGQYEGFELALSMGAALSPEHATEYTELFRRADQALYAVKNSGRRQYRYYEPAMKNILSKSVISPIDSEEEACGE